MEIELSVGDKAVCWRLATYAYLFMTCQTLIRFKLQWPFPTPTPVSPLVLSFEEGGRDRETERQIERERQRQKETERRGSYGRERKHCKVVLDKTLGGCLEPYEVQSTDGDETQHED